MEEGHSLHGMLEFATTLTCISLVLTFTPFGTLGAKHLWDTDGPQTEALEP